MGIFCDLLKRGRIPQQELLKQAEEKQGVD